MIRWQTTSLKTLTTASTAKHRSANLYLKNPCIVTDAGIFIGRRFAGGGPKTGIKGCRRVEVQSQQEDSGNANAVSDTLFRKVRQVYR